MKKLSNILLALALALVFTVPAMAIHIGDKDSPEGSLGITGNYRIDGESVDIDGNKADYMDDDFDLSIVMERGPVKGYVSLELSDRTFVGDAGGSPGGGDDAKIPAVDNYYIEWTAMDNLKVKMGEWGLGFARSIGTDGAGASNIQVTYMMDALDITGTLSKEVEGWSGTDDDNDTLMIKVDGKQAGPFTTASVVSFTQMNDLSGTENSYIGLDLALPLGPVDLAFEYGGNGGDLDGEFFALFVDLAFIQNFGVTVNYFLSSDDYTPYEGADWSPTAIFGDNINEELIDMSALWLEFTYDVNDKLRIGAQALVLAENDNGDEYGTEIGAGLTYKLADNVTYKAAFSSYAEGDGVHSEDVDYDELFHTLSFKF